MRNTISFLLLPVATTHKTLSENNNLIILTWLLSLWYLNFLSSPFLFRTPSALLEISYSNFSLSHLMRRGTSSLPQEKKYFMLNIHFKIERMEYFRTFSAAHELLFTDHRNQSQVQMLGKFHDTSILYQFPPPTTGKYSYNIQIFSLTLFWVSGWETFWCCVFLILFYFTSSFFFFFYINLFSSLSLFNFRASPCSRRRSNHKSRQVVCDHLAI